MGADSGIDQCLTIGSFNGLQDLLPGYAPRHAVDACMDLHFWNRAQNPDAPTTTGPQRPRGDEDGSNRGRLLHPNAIPRDQPARRLHVSRVSFLAQYWAAPV